MKIVISALDASGNQGLVGMQPLEVGTIPFPSGAMAILEPMTYFTEIDAEIVARRIEVPGPAVATMIATPAETIDGRLHQPRPFAMVLTFSDAEAVSQSVFGEITIDVARIMFADAGLLADTWARDEAGYKASKALSLADAIAQKLLTVGPIHAAEQATDGNVMLYGSILTSLTGWGDGHLHLVRHDDADGNLVRVVVSFLEDDFGNPVDFLDFGLLAEGGTVKADETAFQDFTFDPYASRRKTENRADGTLVLSVATRTGTGRDMPGPITVPPHLVKEVNDCMYSCGEAVSGKAKMIDGRLVMQLIFKSALWTDMRGNWYNYKTLEPVDMYGDPLKAAA